MLKEELKIYGKAEARIVAGNLISCKDRRLDLLKRVPVKKVSEIGQGIVGRQVIRIEVGLRIRSYHVIRLTYTVRKYTRPNMIDI